MKLQGDRLNRGWRDQPTRATNKGRYRPQFAHDDDLLTRTRCFKCGELGHLARNCSQKKEDDPSLFSGDEETITESETFFSGMACDDFNTEAFFAGQQEMFLPDSNIDEKEGTFLFDSNVDVRKETFLCYSNVEDKEKTFLLDPNVEDKKETFLYDSNTEAKEETFLRNTMLEEKDESSLYYPHVSSEERREIVPLSGSGSEVVCPQEFLAGVDHRGSLVYADHFLFGASLNFSTVDCVVGAGTTKLFHSGLSEGCVMEGYTAGLLSSGPFVDSPDAKSQMAIHIRNGVSVRAAYKAMRKRVRVEARRQRELEEGRLPEVLLESFLELLKHKLRRPPELPKRVLTSAAKAAKHRRVRDKRRSETLCWWIANSKECFKGDRCAFEHSVLQVQGTNCEQDGCVIAQSGHRS